MLLNLYDKEPKAAFRDKFTISKQDTTTTTTKIYKNTELRSGIITLSLMASASVVNIWTSC